MRNMIKIKSDKYKKSRGGASKVLQISCSACKSPVCLYQKDGSGALKRMYLDRITNSIYENLQRKNLNDLPQFVCPSCKSHLGSPMIYKPENRLAYRLFVSAVTKRTLK